MTLPSCSHIMVLKKWSLVLYEKDKISVWYLAATWCSQLNVSVIASWPFCSSFAHKQSCSMANSDKDTLKLWSNETEQGHFTILSKHRQKQVHCTTYKKPNISLSVKMRENFISSFPSLQVRFVEMPNHRTAPIYDNTQSKTNLCFLRYSPNHLSFRMSYKMFV